MFRALQNLFRVETLRKKIFLTLGLLVVYRLGSAIPLPGVDYDALTAYANRGDDGGIGALLGLFSALSGGSFNQPVVFSLGILPYITASIIMSLMVKVIPSLEAIQKEGASGQKRINQWSRLLTVPLCLVQGTVIVTGVFAGLAAVQPDGAAGPVIPEFSFLWGLNAVIGMTAGTIFLMWVGEQITAHGIGNGISLLIAAGIVGEMPMAFIELGSEAAQNRSKILSALVLLAVYVVVVLGIVYMTKGQRRIPIQQAKQMRGNKMMGGARHYLPIKLNMANVMPVIFASALLTLPATIMAAVSESGTGWLDYGGWWYVTLFAAMIFFFSYFWTSLMFQPSEMANNLKEYGSFVPGYTPGKKTANFLEKVLVRITLVGAAYLTVVAVIPTLVTKFVDVNPFVAGFVGGTGLLIVVGVTLDLVDQLNANLLQRNYEGFMTARQAKRGSRR